MEHYYIESKKCPNCKRVRSRNEFYKDSSRKDGLQAICAECARKKRQEQSKKNASQVAYPYIEYRVCYGCGEEKHRSTFGKDRNDKYGINGRCRECVRVGNKNNYVKYDRPGEADSRSKLYKGTIRGKLLGLLGNSKRRAKQKKLKYELDFEWLSNLYKTQNACCILTSLPLSFEFNKSAKRQWHPFSPSLDRKNPAEGYTKANTRLVCMAINVALNQHGEEVFRQVAEAYLTNLS